jgi:hypothetical protein
MYHPLAMDQIRVQNDELRLRNAATRRDHDDTGTAPRRRIRRPHRHDRVEC